MRSCGSNETGDRTELLRLAIEKSKVKYHTEFPNNGIYLFDDSTKGLESGKSLGIVSIGVATGPQSYEELLTHSPNHLFRDFSDYEKVLNIVLS